MISRVLLVLLAAVPLAAAEKPYLVVPVQSSRIAVPKGWLDVPALTSDLYRQGDGIGVPATDETGAPLQIGLTVKKHGEAKESLKEIVSQLIAGAKLDSRLQMVGKGIVVPFKLSDGTDALLLTAEFIKGGDRRSLQIKVVAKDKQSNVWIVSGHLVGGKNSKWPTAGSSLAGWLAAHLTSFTLDEKKFDAKRVEAAYAKR